MACYRILCDCFASLPNSLGLKRHLCCLALKLPASSCVRIDSHGLLQVEDGADDMPLVASSAQLLAVHSGAAEMAMAPMHAATASPLQTQQQREQHPVAASDAAAALEPVLQQQQQPPEQFTSQAGDGPAANSTQADAGVHATTDTADKGNHQQQQRRFTMQLWASGSSRLSGEVQEVVVVGEVGYGGFSTVYKVMKSSSSSSGDSRDVNSATNADGSVEGSSSSITQQPVPMALKVANSHSEMTKDYQGNVSLALHDELMKTQFKAEQQVMSSAASSAFILTCFGSGCVEVKGATRPCLLLELSPYGPVSELLSDGLGRPVGLSPDKAYKIILDTAFGLEELHRDAKAMHRDLKADNLLMFRDAEDPTVKLADFGICKILKNPGTCARTQVGTAPFKAPEQLNRAAAQDARVDTYQLAMLLLQLRWGRLPFWWLWEDCTSEEKWDQRRGVHVLEEEDCPYSKEQPGFPALTPKERAFLQRCMRVDVSLRPYVSELVHNDDYIVSGP